MHIDYVCVGCVYSIGCDPFLHKVTYALTPAEQEQFGARYVAISEHGDANLIACDDDLHAVILLSMRGGEKLVRIAPYFDYDPGGEWWK